MGRIVDASVPGMVDHDRACWLLAERAVLGSAVCREVAAARPKWNLRAASAALDLLMRWLEQHKLTLRSLEGMTVPELAPVFFGEPVPDPEPRALAERILAAEEVCYQFHFVFTADTMSELESDRRRVLEALDAWLAAGH